MGTGGVPHRGRAHWRHPFPETAEWLSAGLVFGATIAVLAAASRWGSPVRRAAVLAAAAALTWALEATLLKTATQTLATSGIGGWLTRHADR